MLDLPPNLCAQVIATGFLILAFGSLRTAERCQGLFSLLASLRLMLSALNRVSKTSIPKLSPQAPNYSSHPDPPQKVTSPLTLERWQRAFSISPTVFLPLNHKRILFLHLYFRFHISDVSLGFHGNSLSGPVIQSFFISFKTLLPHFPPLFSSPAYSYAQSTIYKYSVLHSENNLSLGSDHSSEPCLYLDESKYVTQRKTKPLIATTLLHPASASHSGFP